MAVIVGSKEKVVKELKQKYNIDYDPGDCVKVEIEVDESKNRIVNEICYA